MRRLFANPGHVAGALGMMANWDLDAFRNDWPRLTVPVALVVAEGDKAVPPKGADVVAQALANARVHRLKGLGHLAHEEAPEIVADLIRKLAFPSPLAGEADG